MPMVSRILIYHSDSEQRLIKALLNRYVKGKVVQPSGDVIEEKFIMDSDNILKAIMDDMTGGTHGKVS